MKRTRTSIAALAAGAALTLGGCSMLSGGLYDTPLPGGADLGSDPYTLTAEFDDVLDLVPQSSVKVDNVDVGKVTSIRLSDDGRHAVVTMKVNDAVDLPAGTTARVQQTSLLGEKYVAFVRPDEPQSGARLSDGDHLSARQTDQAAQVEEVLGALSLVLNGGGIEQFQEISRELQAINEGRPDEIKGFLQTMDVFVSGLDERKEAITGAIDGLAAISETLNDDRESIERALEDLSPGMQVIVDQRSELVSMLEALDELSAVSVSTLDAAQDDIVADLKALDPILDRLAAAGSALPESLEIMLTYPFPDSVLDAIKGDYMNVFVTTNFRTPEGLWLQPTSGVGGASAMALTWPESSDEVPPMMLPPTSSPLPGLPEPTVTVPTTRPTQPSIPTQRPTTPAPTTPTTPAAPDVPPTVRPGGDR